MIITLVKLGLLLLSYLGWWEFFRGRCRMNVYFAPAFTVTAHFTLLFLPGLLNLLLETAWVLYLSGFVMLADALRREKLGFAKHYINFGYGLMLAVLAIMALALRGKIITWSDNFTHWATVVKNMLAADQFPTFAQEAVTFTTYPLGSSTIIWYFSRFTSREEDFWMLAQGFMMLTMLTTLAFSGVLLAGGRGFAMNGKSHGYCAGYSVLCSVGNLLLLLALLHLPASVQYPIVTGGVIVFSTAIALLRRERVTKKEILAAAIAFAASALMAL